MGKTETAFNVRLNNHRSNALHPKEDTIPACKHFNREGHNFNRDAKFIIIEQIRNIEGNEGQLKNTILARENFWIKKLQTLKPKGFNQELNLIAP